MLSTSRHERINRELKALRIAMALHAKLGPVSELPTLVEQMSAPLWAALCEHVGVRLGSDITRALVVTRLREMLALRAA